MMSGPVKYLRPPRFAELLLRLLINHKHPETMLGDLEEMYVDFASEKGRTAAYFWYWFQALNVFPAFIVNSFYWSNVMISGYIRIALRTLMKYKTYSFINVTGLAFGIACSVLILIWASDELSFDRFHENRDKIFRVVFEEDTIQMRRSYWQTPVPLAPALQKNFPEIEYATCMDRSRDVTCMYNDNIFEQSIALVDSNFFNMFTVEILVGSAHSILSAPNSAIITAELAEKMFGDDDPIGKSFNVNQRLDLQVRGIMKKMPANSSFQFDILTGIINIETYMNRENLSENWGSFGYRTYITLNSGVNWREFSDKIGPFLNESLENSSEKFRLYLAPFSDFYLHELNGGGRITKIYIFSIIGAVILLLACINFVNLSVSQYLKRSREIGIRKVVGAYQSSLRTQFFLESLIFVGFATIAGLLMCAVLLPIVNNLAGKELSLHNLLNFQTLAGIVVIMLIAGIAAGSYPAFYVASFNPVSVLKGTASAKPGQSILRKSLIIVQFAASVFLIISTFIVMQQLDFMNEKDLGFQRENLAYIRLNDEIRKNDDAFKTELLNSPDIANVTYTSVLIGTGTNRSASGITMNNDPNTGRILYNLVSVDKDFAETFGLTIAEGRFLEEERSDDEENYLLNQEAVRQLGEEQVIGKKFDEWGDGSIIGVVKNFHLETLHGEIEPIIFFNNSDIYRFVVFKIPAGRTQSALRHVEEVFDRFSSGAPFKFSFLDEEFAKLYEEEQRLAQIVGYFSLIAMIIAGLGLFGLTAFMVEYRTKEIGIRKVLGASVVEIVSVFNKEFLVQVAAANLIAWPLSYFLMDRWLQDFAFRTDIGFGVFIFSGIITLALAAFTVSARTIRASLRNPAHSIRYE